MREKEAAEIVAGLFESSYSALVRFAARRAGSLESAEDLVQDALLELHRALCEGKSVHQPKFWTLVVLQRKICKEIHSRFPGVPVETLDAMDALTARPAAPEPRLAPGEVKRLLAVLTPREQEVVLLRMESLKYREIAKSLHISKSAVNALIARALRKLKVAVGAETPGTAVPEHTDEYEPQTLQ